jgi:hypothetical protein
VLTVYEVCVFVGEGGVQVVWVWHELLEEGVEVPYVVTCCDDGRGRGAGVVGRIEESCRGG